VLSFLAGIRGAVFLQDREARRRLRGVVRAVRAEVDRLGTEVGAKNPDYLSFSVPGSRALIPQVSPWVEGRLPDLATANPALVADILAPQTPATV
jgi:hypothetical protein